MGSSRIDLRCSHLTHFDNLVIETPANDLHHLDQLHVADEK